MTTMMIMTMTTTALEKILTTIFNLINIHVMGWTNRRTDTHKRQLR